MERSRFKRLRFVTLGIMIFFFLRDIYRLLLFYSWKILFSRHGCAKKGRGKPTTRTKQKINSFEALHSIELWYQKLFFFHSLSLYLSLSLCFDAAAMLPSVSSLVKTSSRVLVSALTSRVTSSPRHLLCLGWSSSLSFSPWTIESLRRLAGTLGWSFERCF